MRSLLPPAPAIPSGFETVADACTRDTGLSRAARAEVEAEIVDHLECSWECRVAAGADPVGAALAAIEAFGPVARVRRGLIVRRLVEDARDAVRLPAAWRWVLAVDLLSRPMLGVLADPGAAAASWLVPYLVMGTLLCWTGYSAFRLGWRLCGHAIARRAAPAEAIAGTGLMGGAVGLLLSLGPGALFPALCDAIERVAGAQTPVAAFTLALGTSLAIGGLIQGTLRRA